MNDIPRNEAYEIALRESCQGKVVLDIGSVRSGQLRRECLVLVSHILHVRGQGSGLLAMLAAQAGATHVYTIEANPDFARLASEIVELNHLNKKVTVINTLSTKLEVKQGVR